MQEAFLHYLWQTQRFLTTNLQTTDGDSIRVTKRGFLNSDAGPDFLNARLQIGQVAWAGNVEIHINASDWLTHHHETDRAYDNVILHVVWKADKDIYRPDNSKIPVLELCDIVSPKLVDQQRQLLENQSVIPCENHFREVSEFTKASMLGVALTQRLEEKAEVVKELLEANAADWEETTYQLLAKNFGFKLNAEPMLQLARNLPLKILQKHSNNALQIEALLFGTAGLLENTADDYGKKLQQEYDFLAAKYELKNRQMNSHEWKFLRTRPANFPTIRLAQLVTLIASQRSFFSLFTQTTTIAKLKTALAVEQPVYWQQHYDFDKPLARPLKQLGEASVENILINTAVPVLVCYAQYIDNQELIQRAEEILASLPPERNRIITLWESLGLKIESSFDSQAGIELYNNFCTKKKCLRCKIGTEILQTTSD